FPTRRSSDLLRFTAGERGGVLSQADVGEADVHESLQLLRHDRHVAEEIRGILDGHLEDLVDVLALVTNLQRLAVVALAAADVAGDVDIREEVHLDLDDAIALAGFAAAALDIEAEAPGHVAARAGFLGAGEQFADRREQSTVGSRVRSWRAADGALADVDDAIDEFESADAIVWRGIPAGAIESICYCLVQRVVDQRGFAGAGHTG